VSAVSQDDFYFKKEANDFFNRWYSSIGKDFDGGLRENKKSILDNLETNISLNGSRVLEVGSFVSDLLSHLKKNYYCDVYGVEASSKACDLAKRLYGLDIENNSFVRSAYFNLESHLKASFDLIIFDDVLSWMSRSNILQVIAVADWLLRDGGALFIRDFSPKFAFAYENHHQKGFNVYNFKHAGGHRDLFLSTGNYFEKYTKIYTTTNLQNVSVARPDGSTWADSIIIKTPIPLHPLLEL
jgi:SAM-dependent methyltransferase